MELFHIHNFINIGTRTVQHKEIERLKPVVHRTGSRAIVAVHLGSSVPLFDKHGQHTNEYFTGRTDRQIFDAYLNRVRVTLNATLLPIFIFQEEIDRRGICHSIEDTVRWLTSQGISPVSPLTIYVPTKTDHPLPVWQFETKEKESWGILGDIMRRLGISEATIIGEELTTREDKTRFQGTYYSCVGITWTELSTLFGDPEKTVVEQDLTFPNLEL